MADEAKKRSSWVGPKHTHMEKYIEDMDKDVFNLYQEKTLNIQFLKRYAIMANITQG